MISNNVFNSFAEAYTEGLSDLIKHGDYIASVKDPSSPASGFGQMDRPAIELTNYNFEIKNILSSSFYNPNRILRLPYSIGLFIWSLSGSDDVEWLSFYHPFAKEFSDDGQHLCGAFGKRMFNYGNAINQMEVVRNKLSNDSMNRRATILILTPEDHLRTTKEFPCCIGVQYFLREGKLNSISYMRAQSGLVVLPYDVFLFINLQIALALRLEVELGWYKHNCATYHIYQKEKEICEKLIAYPLTIPVQFSPPVQDYAQIEILIDFERALRIATTENDIDKVKSIISMDYSRNEYFNEIKIILIIFCLNKLKYFKNEVTNFLELLKEDLKILTKNSILSNE